MTGKFIKIKCKCGSEMRVFSHSSSKVLCSACKQPVLHPTGGEAVILAQIIEE